MTGHHPTPQREDCASENDRNEDAGDAIRELLHRRHGALGFADDANDTRERRARSDAGRANEQQTVAVDRARAHDRAGFHLLRDRLAGQHRDVDRAAPLAHETVDRNAFACGHDDRILDDDTVDWDGRVGPVAAPHACGLRLQPEQCPNRGVATAAREHLEIFTERDQRDDRACGLVVTRLHRDGCVDRIGERRRRAERDERIHVGGAVAQLRERTGDAPDRQRQPEHQPILAGKRADEHAEHQRRDEEGDREYQERAPIGDLAISPPRILVAPFVCRIRSVTGALDGRHQGRDGDARLVLDGRTFGRQIDVGRGDARQARKAARNVRDARGAGHPADGEFGPGHDSSKPSSAKAAAIASRAGSPSVRITAVAEAKSTLAWRTPGTLNRAVVAWRTQLSQVMPPTRSVVVVSIAP